VDAAPLAAPLTSLPRTLGFWAVVSLVVGTIIGSGVFRVTSGIAADVGSVGGVAAVWIIGGVVTLCGTLALAELAAAWPDAGGVIVYLREIYGRGTAFVFGWTMVVLAPASSAALALVFAEYFGTIVTLPAHGVELVATAATIVVTVASYLSVRVASAIQGLSSGAKVAAIATLVAVAFALGDPATGAFGAAAPPGTLLWSGLGIGLVPALWAYNGIGDVVSVAGEVRDPARVLPRALIAGTFVVVGIYLAANAAYFYVLPFSTVVASPLVAADTGTRLLGQAGGAFVAVMVMISTFGALNGLILTQPRIFYAMARDGQAFRALGAVHPRHGTPHVVLLAYAGATLLCTWWRSFEQLTEAFILGVWPFYALAVLGVVIARRTRPDVARPYLTPGYPVVPIVFVVAVAWIVGSALVAKPVLTLVSLGLSAIGVPVYFAIRRRG
jgi:amino acid transporter